MSRTFRPKIALLVFSFVPLYSDIVFTHDVMSINLGACVCMMAFDATM